jgi:hypothetical protein
MGVKPSARVVVHSIPVSVPVKKYLEYWKPSVYLANQDDLVGMWLINAYTRKTKQVKVVDKVKAEKNGYRETWHFAIPIRYQDNLIFPERRVMHFNNMVTKFMDFEIISDMEIMRSKGNVFHIQQAINDFRDRYNIYEKEWTDERIRKLYLRWRVRNNTIRTECGNYLPGMLLGKI